MNYVKLTPKQENFATVTLTGNASEASETPIIAKI